MNVELKRTLLASFVWAAESKVTYGLVIAVIDIELWASGSPLTTWD